MSGRRIVTPHCRGDARHDQRAAEVIIFNHIKDRLQLIWSERDAVHGILFSSRDTVEGLSTMPT